LATAALAAAIWQFRLEQQKGNSAMKWQVFESSKAAFIVDTDGYSVVPDALTRTAAYAIVREHNRQIDMAIHNARIESSAAVRAAMKG
jgi:hypothetical protein